MRIGAVENPQNNAIMSHGALSETIHFVFVGQCPFLIFTTPSKDHTINVIRFTIYQRKHMHDG